MADHPAPRGRGAGASDRGEDEGREGGRCGAGGGEAGVGPERRSITAPLVSLVTSTYNRAYCVGETIRSVLGQTFADFEYLIADDGSTDETAAVVRSFRDPRLRYIRHETSQTHAVRNPALLREARGRFVMRIDSDDRFAHEGALEEMVATVSASPDREIVHGWLWRDGRTGRTVDYFRGWDGDRLEYSFDDFLSGEKGYSDILWLAKRPYLERFHAIYDRPYMWFVGLWEALLPDGLLVVHRKVMGEAGWGGSDNVSVFVGGRRFWGMCAEYNEHLADRHRERLRRWPRRLGYFEFWAAYYRLLLGERGPAARRLAAALLSDPMNGRAWTLLACLPLPHPIFLRLAAFRQARKWTWRTAGDWRK